MQEVLETWLPHLMGRLPEFYKSIWDTLAMLAWSGVLVFILGVFFGMLLTVTKRDGILPQEWLYQLIDKAVNVFRSVPFIILLTALLPLTRLISGTAIGVQGAIVPLVFGTVPFFTRQVETALAEVDRGVIEAAEAAGLSPLGIIFRVYLKESIPAMARVSTITAINLLGLTTMAGVVGAGGLGDFAIRYGHNRFQVDMTAVTVAVMILIVCAIQITGSFIVKKSTHK